MRNVYWTRYVLLSKQESIHIATHWLMLLDYTAKGCYQWFFFRTAINKKWYAGTRIGNWSYPAGYQEGNNSSFSYSHDIHASRRLLCKGECITQRSHEVVTAQLNMNAWRHKNRHLVGALNNCILIPLWWSAEGSPIHLLAALPVLQLPHV